MDRHQLQLSVDIDKKPHILCGTCTKGWNSLSASLKSTVADRNKGFWAQKLISDNIILPLWNGDTTGNLRENFPELLKIYWWALVSQNEIETRKYKHYHNFWPLVLSRLPCHQVNNSDVAETKDVDDHSSSKHWAYSVLGIVMGTSIQEGI